MSQSSPHLLSARAIEDIIQVQKLNDKLHKVIESEILKEKIEDVDHSFNKYNPAGTMPDNAFCLPKVIEGTVIKQKDIMFRIRVEGTGSEGDHQNSEFIQLQDKVTDKTDSELELKSWPSDSDVTVIRMKKEFRNELSTRVSWEEERNLTDSYSSVNFDWESHSLINLANVSTKEKDDADRITPFTIWSKTMHNHHECQVSDPKAGEPKTGHTFLKHSQNINPQDILYCPPDEMAFYVPVNSQDNQECVQSFCKPPDQLLPLLDEKINILYKTESSSSMDEKSGRDKEEILDFSSSGNKISKSGKKQFFRHFISCFAKCGSRKNLSEND